MTNTGTMNVKDDTNKDKFAVESALAVPHRAAGAAQLKLLIAAATVTAAWLSYQAVNEAVVLHRRLDQVQAAAVEVMLTKAPANTGANITETNPRVAGL
jgi:hypothetical protein